MRALGLLPATTALFRGFGGDVVELSLFVIDVKIHDSDAVRIRATVGENEPWILLGRDVLNGHKLVLDGPDLALEIS